MVYSGFGHLPYFLNRDSVIVSKVDLRSPRDYITLCRAQKNVTEKRETTGDMENGKAEKANVQRVVEDKGLYI